MLTIPLKNMSNVKNSVSKIYYPWLYILMVMEESERAITYRLARLRRGGEGRPNVRRAFSDEGIGK